MIGKRKAFFIATLQILALFSIIGLMPTTTVVAAPVPSDITGDWVIDSNQTYWGGTCNITGNLIIPGPYTLTLKRSTIRFNPATPGSHGIDVQEAGKLITDNARIMSGNGNTYSFIFQQSSVGIIKNSNISDMSVGFTSSGMTLLSTFVTLDGNDIHNNDMGIFINENISPTIINNTIRDNSFDGIFLRNSGATIKNNIIRNNNNQGDGAQQGYAGATLYLRDPNTPIFEGNIITDNNIAGVDIIDINEMVIRDCYFDNPGAQDIKVDGLTATTSLKTYNTDFETVQMNALYGALGNPTGAKATFQPFWNVDVRVIRESTNTTIEGATVDVRQGDGTPIVSGQTTGLGGMVLGLDVPEYELEHGGQEGDSTQTTDYKPHVVWASADIDEESLSSNTTLDIDSNGLLINVTIDDLLPELLITSPEPGYITNETFVTITGITEHDVTLTVKGNPVAVQLDGSFSHDQTLGEGKNALNIVATDPSGNQVNTILDVYKDTRAPNVIILTPNNGTVTRNPYPYISGTAEYGTSLWINDKIVPVKDDATFNTTVHLVEGENTVTAVAKDKVFNTGTHEIVVFLDSKPPTLAIVEPVDGRKLNDPAVLVMGVTDKDATLTINGMPVMLQVSSFKYQVTLVEGENLIVIKSVDPIGNTAVKIITVYLDTIPPEATISYPPDQTSTNLNKITVRGTTEPGATVKVAGVKVDNIGGAFETEVKLGSSQNKIMVEVIDAMGNSATYEVHVIKDTIPPDLLVQKPKSGDVLNKRSDGKVEVRGTTEEGAVIYVNGELAGVSSTSFQAYVYLAEGNNTIDVTAYDAAGNMETETLYVVYDSGVEFQVLTPADGLTTGSNQVKATGFVEPGASVLVNGEAVIVNDDGGFSHDVPLKDGKNTVTFIFEDAAGNQWSDTRYVTKETSGKQASSSSMPLTLLFLIIIIVLIVVMAAIMMKGRKPKELPVEIDPQSPPPPDFGSGYPPPPGVEGVEPGYGTAPPPPSGYPEGYDQGYGQEGYAQEGYEGYQQEGYAQEGYEGYQQEGYTEEYAQGQATAVEEGPEAGVQDLEGEAEARPDDTDHDEAGAPAGTPEPEPFAPVEETQAPAERALDDRSGEAEVAPQETAGPSDAQPKRTVMRPRRREGPKKPGPREKDVLDDILDS